jgi:hypothetical protein
VAAIIASKVRRIDDRVELGAHRLKVNDGSVSAAGDQLLGAQRLMSKLLKLSDGIAHLVHVSSVSPVTQTLDP